MLDRPGERDRGAAAAAPEPGVVHHQAPGPATSRHPDPPPTSGTLTATAPAHHDQLPLTWPPTRARTMDTLIADALGQATPSSPGGFAIAINDLSTGANGTFTSEEGREFVTASIVKVEILVALALQAQRRSRALTTEEHQLAERMIKVSDNAAASTLWERVGRACGMGEVGDTLGLTDTVPGPDGYWGLTRTTAADQVRILGAVSTADSPLAAPYRSFILGLMRQVTADQKWGVTAAADTPAASAVKNGWLPRTGTGLWVINSIGAVRHAGHRLLIAVLSAGQPSRADGIDLVETIAGRAVSALTDQS